MTPRRQLIDATGSRRRLQALAALGHNARTVATHMGRPQGSARTLISHWRHPNRRRIDARTFYEIDVAYIQLRNTPGTDTVVRINALRAGYHLPAAWDGINIDDPDAEPADTAQSRRIA